MADQPEVGPVNPVAEPAAVIWMPHDRRNARRGDLFVHPELLLTSLVEPAAGDRWETGAPDLTPRETLVRQLLAERGHVRDIARQLGISVHTCRGYVKSLLSKLGAHSQLEAVVAAGRYGLVPASQHR